MSTGVKRVIELVCVNVIKLANGGLAQDKVIVANQPQRPDPPYVMVNVTLHDLTVGADEDVPSLDGSLDPQMARRGRRQATVSWHAYGDLAHEWIQATKLRLFRNDVLTLLNAVNIQLIPLGGISNVDAGLDSRIESRGLQELDVYYELLTDAEARTAVANLNITEDFESPDWDRDYDIPIP